MSFQKVSIFFPNLCEAWMGDIGKRIYRFKSFLLNVEERQLFDGENEIALTPKTFDVLVHLVENAGRLVHKNDLMAAVWPDAFVEEVNVPRSVHHLRKILGQDANGNKFIETVPTKGYRFVASVQVSDSGRPDIGDYDNVIEVRPRQFEGAESELRPREAGDVLHPRKPRGKLAALGLCAVLAVCAAGWLLYTAVFETKLNAPFSQIKLSRLSNTSGVKRLSVSPDGNLIAYVSNEKAGEGLFVRQTQMSNTLNLVQPQKGHFSFVRFSPDGRDVFYGIFTGDKMDTEVYSIPALGGLSRKIPNLVAYSMSFAPDKKHFAHVVSNMEDGEKTLMKSTIDGRENIPLITRKMPRSFNVVEKPCAWSPDGKIIAVISNEIDQNGRFTTVTGVNPIDGSEINLTSKRWRSLDSVTWLKDQSGLLAVGSDAPETSSQIWIISSADGSTRRLTNDLNDYSQIDVTDDGTQIVAMQESSTSGIWTGSVERDQGEFKEIVSQTGRFNSVAITSRGDLVFSSNADGEPDIWAVGPDKEKRQITSGARTVGLGLCVTPDGARVVFPSGKSGKTNLWSVELTGGEPKQLTFGDGEFFPLCSVNGQSVIYQSGFGYGVKSMLWKVPIEGGEPVQLTRYFAMRPAISPDGERIAYFYMADDKWRIGIVSSNGGEMQGGIDVPEGVHDRVVRWSHDSNSLIYSTNTGEVGNVWILPLNGEQPRQLTEFHSHLVEDFAVGKNGNELAVIRIATTEDVVSLISQPQ